jgi:alcohol dehydrogenase YqhD (iron-dependent ADH family)
MLYYHDTATDGGGSVPDSSSVLCCGNIYITDITANGIVSDKVYLPETVPPDTVLVEATTDSDNITIHFIAESSMN